MEIRKIPMETLRRLPRYLDYLKELESEGETVVSSTKIALRFGINAIVVKKDISAVSTVEGKPKIGFALSPLISDLEKCLGYDNTYDVVIVGAGKLGQTLMAYDGFANFGMNITAAIDTDPDKWGRTINGKKIFSPQKGFELIKRLKIKMAIVVVPKDCAQAVVDELAGAGIKGVWNFAPTHINAPSGVVVKQENLAESLLMLSLQMWSNIQQTEEGETE